jgi:hypothetical protein
MYDEVKRYLGKRRIQATRMYLCGVCAATYFRNQAVAGGKSEVVMQVFVAIDVDLGGQFSIAWCGDKEVDVSRASSVPAE